MCGKWKIFVLVLFLTLAFCLLNFLYGIPFHETSIAYKACIKPYHQYEATLSFLYFNLPPYIYNLASLGIGISLLSWLSYKDSQNHVLGVETVSIL